MAAAFATGEGMTDQRLRTELSQLAQFLCTDKGKQFYRNECRGWLAHWGSQSDYEPGEDMYAWEQQDNRRLARNDALAACALELGLDIHSAIDWGAQYDLDARLWANARNAEKLADKLHKCLG